MDELAKSNSIGIVQAAVSAHRNLLILRTLHDVAGHVANDRLLRDIAEKFGLSTTMDGMDHALETLHRESLVSREEVGDLTVVRLTGRGEDVALGRSANEQVAAPSLPW